MGDVIAGRYELLDPIASGASGSVWRAVDHRSGMLCAAKVMRQRDSSDMLRFVREKSIRVEHRNLLTPNGFGAEDDHVVIGMPLASGGTLQEIVQAHGPLSDPLVALILSQLLAGLGRLHQEDWIHRDVKPGNMLFEPVGRGIPIMRLADFGIAVHARDVRLTATGFVNGTPGYVAPEIMSSGRISPQQDLWAAGVVGLVMISPGTRVDREGSGSEAVRAVLATTAPPIAAVIGSLLSVAPEQRCPDLPGAVAALEALARTVAPPFTDRAGAPVEFPDRLPPLPEDSPYRGTDVLRADTAGRAQGSTPLLPGPPRLRTAPASPALPAAPAPVPGRPADVGSWASTGPGVPAPPRPRRRPRVLAGLAVLALAGSAVLGTIAVRGGLLMPDAQQIAQRDPSVRIGASCDWTDAGTEATTAGGVAAICAEQGPGEHRWERAGR